VSTLRQSQLRVDRAQKKLATLKRVIENARKAALKATAEQTDLNAPEPLTDFMWRIRDEACFLTSEFALHARVALDYVVFALARRDTRIEQEGTQFPINEREEDFARNRTGCLKHLTAEHVTMVENFQPYRGFRLRPLILLHKLSNRDKHREFARISFTRMIQQDPVLQAGPPVIGITKMEMNVGHTYEVLLQEGIMPEPEVTTLVEALAQILSLVRQIVDYFDRILA
jgi:hypothetical protein